MNVGIGHYSDFKVLAVESFYVNVGIGCYSDF